MNNRYEIRTVADMLKVPADKRQEMLRDFYTWLTFADSIKIDTKAFKASINTDVFVWIDDGREGVSHISASLNGKKIIDMGV